MVVQVEDVQIAFQPVFSLRSGSPVAIAASAAPDAHPVPLQQRGGFRRGASDELDLRLVDRAVCVFTERQQELPLHLACRAGVLVQRPDLVDRFHARMCQIGQVPHRTVIELGAPFGRIDVDLLLSVVHRMRQFGYGIGVKDVGSGDVPLSLLTSLCPDVLKLDSGVVAGLPADPAATGCVEAMATLAERIGARLVADGVTECAQLAALHRIGVPAAQGEYLSPKSDRPAGARSIEPLLARAARGERLSTGAVPTAADLLRAPVTLPHTVTADAVRSAFTEHEDAGSVVLLDEAYRPVCSLQRNAFLLTVTGAYGHALYANRPAAGIADDPRTVRQDTGLLQLLDIVAAAGRAHGNDDLVVVDGDGACVGSLTVVDVIRAVAELKTRQAESLNPLTRLPGTDAVSTDIAQRLASNSVFAVSWLDVDGFKQVNDRLGFAAGDELIRSIGAMLTSSASAYPGTLVCHIGGDDFILTSELEEIMPLLSKVVRTPLAVGVLRPSVSVASLVCLPSEIQSYQDASALLAPLKKHAKGLSGTSWVLGRSGTERYDVLHGRAQT